MDKNQTDSEFNRILLKEVLPAISTAFLSLNAEACGTRLRINESHNEVRKRVISKKADQMKKVVNRFIDLQMKGTIALFPGEQKQETEPNS